MVTSYTSGWTFARQDASADPKEALSCERSGSGRSLAFENGNLCFEDAAAAAGRTLRRLGQFSLVEGKPAGAALRRLNDHAVPGGADRADHMLEIRLDLAARQSKLTRDARNRARGVGQHIDQLAAKCHSSLCGSR